MYVNECEVDSSVNVIVSKNVKMCEIYTTIYVNECEFDSTVGM